MSAGENYSAQFAMYDELKLSLKRISLGCTTDKIDEKNGRWITVHPNGSSKGRVVHVDGDDNIDSDGPLSNAIKREEAECDIIRGEMNDSGLSKSVMSAIESIPDAEFESIYHGGKNDFVNSGVCVLFKQMSEGKKAYYDHAGRIIYVNSGLKDDISALTKCLKHELTHVRQAAEGVNVPKGFDPDGGDVSALKYFVDPGELEAEFAAEGKLDEFSDLKEMLTEPMSGEMEDVEVGDFVVTDWKKTCLSEDGIRQLIRASHGDDDIKGLLERAGVSDSKSLLPAKIDDIGKRIMDDQDSYLVSSAVGYRYANPGAYKTQVVKDGMIRLEIRGKYDNETKKRKNINAVTIADNLKRIGIKACAVGPNEIDIYATDETVSKMSEVNKMLSMALSDKSKA